jgi:hypothetical protein
VKSTLAATLALATAVVVGRRSRQARRVHALARQLATGGVGERINVALALVDEGLRASAPQLLLLVRTDHSPALLHAVAQAVSDAPPVARPSPNVRELLEWSDAELSSLRSEP